MDRRIHVAILHFDDICEITLVSGGKEGGGVYVAMLRNRLLARNPNTMITLGGDVFTPLAVGPVEYAGDPIGVPDGRCIETLQAGLCHV